MNPKKDRHLSPLDYLDVLQVEYLMNKLKHDIYPSPRDRSYYKKVMGHKKERIEGISAVNNLPNIFKDADLYEEYRLKVYPTQGLPVIKLTADEIAYYYTPQQDVRVNGDKVMVGKIESHTKDFSFIQVRIRGEAQARTFPSKSVTRVF